MKNPAGAFTAQKKDGMFRIDMPIKHRMPMMSESSTLPPKKPPAQYITAAA